MNNLQGQDGSGRTVLITGAAQRIGHAIALAFASAGWRIAVHYRSSASAAQKLVDAICEKGGHAIMLQADLADADQTQDLIPRCAEAMGAPVCLVNNASLFLQDELTTLDPASWQAHMDANLRAPVLLTQSFAKHLPSRENGSVVNIVDQRVLKPAPDFFSYTVSKAGLWWVTRTMAQALAPEIRVNAVSPGPVLPSIHQTPEDFATEEQQTLLKHGAAPEEIASATLFLAQAPSVTGQMICVDSGQHLA
jgi:NAD(P)-dependent dehydrogenase (short-subunit alcohol dehydrogenase family)